MYYNYSLHLCIFFSEHSILPISCIFCSFPFAKKERKILMMSHHLSPTTSFSHFPFLFVPLVLILALTVRTSTKPISLLWHFIYKSDEINSHILLCSLFIMFVCLRSRAYSFMLFAADELYSAVVLLILHFACQLCDAMMHLLSNHFRIQSN